MISQESDVPTGNLTQQDLLDRITQQQNALDYKDRMIQVLQLQISKQEQDIFSLREETEQLRQSMEALLKKPPSTASVSTVVTTTLTTTDPIMVPAPTVTFSTDLTNVYPSPSQWSLPTFPPGLGPKKSPKNPAKVLHSQPKTVTLITLDSSTESSRTESESSEENQAGVDPEMQRMADLLGRKETPKPEPYDLASGRSFSKFLESFEAYCGARYSRQKQSLWTPELGRFLKGEALMAFNAFGGPEKSYRKMKNSLQTWYLEAKDRASASRRSQYRDARINQGECYRIFATRLENLYRTAYPQKSVDGKALKESLLERLPRQVADSLERDLALLRVANQRSNTWQDVLLLLGLQDETTRRTEGRKSSVQATRMPAQPWGGAGSNPVTMRVVATGNSPSRPANTGASPRPQSRSPTMKCHYCKRPGHRIESCRRRLNQCLRCGASDHFVAQCQMPQSGQRPRSLERRSSSSTESLNRQHQSRPRSQEQRTRVYHRVSDGPNPRSPLNP